MTHKFRMCSLNGQQRSKRASGNINRLSLGICLLPVLLAACAQQTLFQSNFNSTAAGQPPSHAQPVGTVNISGPPGSVIVVASPVQTEANGFLIAPTPQMIRKPSLLSKATSRSSPAMAVIPAMQACSFPPARNSGDLQFEQFNQSVANSFNGFLHLDFPKDGTIRIDDLPGTGGGEIPHDQPFIVQVTLNINATPTAHVLAGAGGRQGSYAIQTPLIPLARQFGAVRLWMGLPWTGPFDATNIVVTKSQ